MKIFFTNVTKSTAFKPEPASSVLPDWYKNTNSYLDNLKEPFLDSNYTRSTIKKCIPIFDAISSGYIIFSSGDLFIKQVEENGRLVPYYRWRSQDLLDFHGEVQAKLHPLHKGEGLPYPKWINPWAIKTPKGYSCLFTTPLNRDIPFTIMPGIVDTDTYNAPVNFPFVLNDITFEGIIPAGTPIAQVIPFKRDSWEINYGSEKEIKDYLKSEDLTSRRFFDSYKKLFWSKKIYK